MRRLSILLVAIAAFPVVTVAETKEGNPPVGRYDITFSVEGLYFLDTATGALWLKENQGKWKRVDSPVNRRPSTDRIPDEAISLALPKHGATMPMTQREKREIPGSSDTLFLQLGDITGGQVVVEVVDINGRCLVDRTSLKNNEFLKFEVDERDVYLQITDMVNNLVGEDICKAHISFQKPKIERKDEESKETRE